MDYLDASGESAFEAWRRGLPPRAQVQIDTRLKYMRVMERWPDKWVSSYKGYDDILELRIPFDKVQYRPLGCYGPGRGIFTLLIGAIERSRKIPYGNLQAARSRRATVYADQSRIREHEYDD
jgi:hypothetical protein